MRKMRPQLCLRLNPYQMKKILRVLGLLLLLLVVITLGLIAFAPQQYSLERSVTVNAPQTAVFTHMSHFKQWPAWTAWAEMDPTQKTTFTGTDGTPGSTYHWMGEEVGEGEMINTSVTANAMNYKLDFIKPFEAHNTGWVKAEPVGNGTKATMGMIMSSPRPFNAIGWLFKGSVGDDFEKSLNKLKAGVERGTITARL